MGGPAASLWPLPTCKCNSSQASEDRGGEQLLTPGRALTLHSDSGRLLPEIPALKVLYDYGCQFRHGQVIMIAGRSGSQKSGLAMWLVKEWNLPTLYFSADMSPFTASCRLASSYTGNTTEEIENAMAMGGPARQRVLEALSQSQITFSFGSPLSWRQIAEELDAYVELWDAFPEVMVFDNLCDFDGAESDYTEQMAVMQGLTELARETGSTVLIMHHASDKSWDARNDPWSPPSRDQVKGGLSEKPELSLSVALNPNSLEFNVAVIKQRSGPQDPTAKRWRTLRCVPELTRFEPWTGFHTAA